MAAEIDFENEHRVVKEFASAASMQAQFANRIWLGLVTVSLIALLPVVDASNKTVGMPFGLGKADAHTFSIFVCLMLVVLSIAFTSAYAQSLRAQLLAQEYLDGVSWRVGRCGPAEPREWFDILRLPTFNRVAPLAQLSRGKYQFFATRAGCPRIRRFVSTAYYVVLKLTALGVYFGLPGYALFLRAYLENPHGRMAWPIRVAAALALVTMVQLLARDIQSFGKVLPAIWQGGAKETLAIHQDKSAPAGRASASD